MTIIITSSKVTLNSFSNRILLMIQSLLQRYPSHSSCNSSHGQPSTQSHLPTSLFLIILRIIKRCRWSTQAVLPINKLARRRRRWRWCRIITRIIPRKMVRVRTIVIRRRRRRRCGISSSVISRKGRRNRRCRRVIITRRRGNMVIRWRQGPFSYGELQPDFPLRTAGGTSELKRPNLIGIVRINQVPQ